MAKAVMHSGSYMLFDRHFASPDKSEFEKARYETPNYSGRMDNLRAAILRPQLAQLDEKCTNWNRRYSIIETVLAECAVIRIPKRSTSETFVGSSIQFSIPSFSAAQIAKVMGDCDKRGVVLKWFGNAEPTDYTSRYDSWRYIENMPDLPNTRTILSTLLDMRIPLTFSEDDCELIAQIIVDVVKGSEER